MLEDAAVCRSRTEISSRFCVTLRFCRPSRMGSRSASDPEVAAAEEGSYSGFAGVYGIMAPPVARSGPGMIGFCGDGMFPVYHEPSMMPSGGPGGGCTSGANNSELAKNSWMPEGSNSGVGSQPWLVTA